MSGTEPRKPGRPGLGLRPALGLALLASALCPVQAEPSRIGVTSYLRVGPGLRYRPVDEVLSGRSVEVLDCDPAWCRIRAGDRVGWVARGTLVEGPSPMTPTSAATCFVNAQSGYHGTRDLRFCSPGASGP